MTLATRLTAVVQAIAADIKALYALAGGSSGAVLTFRPWYRYKFTEAGTTIAYTYIPGYINVYRDGHLLRPTEDYDDSNGTSIVFTQTQAIDVEIDIQPYSMENLDAGNLRTRYDLVATDGQTVFTGLSFATGTADVYRNGLLLPKTEYSENGTALTLLDPCALNDNILILSNKLIPLGSYLTTDSLIPINTKIGVLGNLFTPTKTDLVTAINESARMYTDTRTSNVQLTAADHGKTIIYTSGSFSQSFDTLPTGWFVVLWNKGAGDIQLNTDGVTYFHYPREQRVVFKTATGLESYVLTEFFKTFTSSGTFVMPPGYNWLEGQLFSGGAGGAFTTGTNMAQGGGGGGCIPFLKAAPTAGSSSTVVIGAGGVARSALGNCQPGGDSTFLTIKVLGADSGGYGGGLEGSKALYNDVPAAEFGGGKPNGSPLNTNGGYGGGAGAGSGYAGNSVFGGGGGDGLPSGSATIGYGKGLSMNAGNGGLLNMPGDSPAGGGGASRNGNPSGPGGNGELRVWGKI